MLSSILPAAFSGIGFFAALRRLPLLHPVQVWCGSWAVATTLYAFRLLPYRDLSWLTAALICGAVLAFAAGAPLGERIAALYPVRRRVEEDAHIAKLAALLSIGLLAATLAVFVAQLVSRYGFARALRISPEVKLYLASGEAPLSGTYVDFAVAAAASCGLTAALATARAPRLGWLAAAAICAGTVYFSTSRGFIVVALISGLAPLALVSRRVNRRWLAAVAIAVAVATVVLFIGLGTVLGKTYGNSTIGGFDNFFSRHTALRSLALPYQDTTASIAALNLLVGVTPTWGVAHGCATAPIPCGFVRKLGVPAVRVPVAGPFTKGPLPWNAYTFLDRFLIDGGTGLALVMVALTGALAGAIWARARAGSAPGIVIYAICVPALVAAYRQNLIELVGIAAIIGAGVWMLARLLSRLRANFGRAPARAT